jgi:probable HAF family extracellular repeat protein
VKSIATLTLGLLMLAVASTASAQKTQYFQYPGASSTFVTGVSNTGVILGYYLDSQSNAHGFSLSHGQYTSIDDPDGTNTTPSGINSAGTIVGYYFSSSSNGYHAFSYSDGTFTDIVVSADCINTYAYGINDNGDMAGQCQTNGETEGWTYKNGSFQLISLPGSAWSYATDINVHGSSTWIYSPLNSTRVESAVYNGTTFSNIDEPNKRDTYAWAINAAGNVAISWLSGEAGYGAIMVGKTYHNIQPAKCTTGTQITGINDHGLAVGMCGTGGNVQYGMMVSF